MSHAVKVPSAITFQEAITFTQSVLDQREQASLEASDFKDVVTGLVATHNGARGFFVAYLTDARPLIDILLPEVAEALKNGPKVVPELLVKNLAMSTAMELTHQSNGHSDQAAQSAQVQRRTAALISQLGFPYIKAEAEGLAQGLRSEPGAYAAFLQQWGYDEAQKMAIAHQLKAVCPEINGLL